MRRDPRIEHATRVAQERLEKWICRPLKISKDEIYRELLLVRLLSNPDKVRAPEGGQVPILGGPENHPLVYDDEKAAHLITEACSGDVNADVVLSSVAAKYVSCGCAMPPLLRDYITRKLDAMMATGEPWPKPRTRGRKRNGNLQRDWAITWAVEHLRMQGFPLGSDSARHSASSIVADALTNWGITLDDRRVAQIWNANRRLAGF
jgi:hypothetical protein